MIGGGRTPHTFIPQNSIVKPGFHLDLLCLLLSVLVFPAPMSVFALRCFLLLYVAFVALVARCCPFWFFIALDANYSP